jgi:hypothetical protein
VASHGSDTPTSPRAVLHHKDTILCTFMHTTVCRGKIPEKIWLNIKHFIKRKIKIKIVSFLSRQSLLGAIFILRKGILKLF